MHEECKEIEILTSAKKCFDTICDFESYPAWQKTIKAVNILDRENGRPVIVEYKLDAILKTIEYTLNYIYKEDDPKKLFLGWTYAGGDLKKIEGSYTFTALNEQKTLATYRLVLDLGITVPGFILKKFKENAMEDSIVSLKKRAESQ